MSNLFMKYLIVFLLFIPIKYLSSQWSLINTFSNPGVNPNISVIDQNTFWIAGGTDTPSVWRSTNGGANITNISTGGIALDLYCVWGIDSNTCYAGDGGKPGGSGGNAKVYKTTNAGSTWNTILSTGDTSGFISGIVFSRSDPSIGIIESDPPAGPGNAYWWQLTTNGGSSWTQINGPALGSDYTSAQNSIFCIDKYFWGAGTAANSGNTGKIFWTTNSGGMFNNVLLPLTGGQDFVSTITFNTDKLNGVAALSNSLPNIARTTNGGLNWSVSNVGAGISGYCNAKWVPGTNTIYLLGSSGIYPGRKSTDGGISWTTMTTGGINNFSHMDFVVSSNIVYAYSVTTDGKICKLAEPLIGISNNSNILPKEFELMQNYPNPFNPTTKIDYALQSSSFISLSIYDMRGNNVMTVVNENQEAGKHSVIIDLSEFSSGIYFYTLKAGNFMESKKMALVK